MSANETYYRRVISTIGWAMLLFWALINAVGLLLGGLQMALLYLSVSKVASEVIYQLCYAAGYLFSFMFPVLFIKIGIQKCGYIYQPIKTDLRLTPLLIPIVFGGITLIWAQANINSALVSIFNYSEFSAEVLWGMTDGETKGYQIVLAFIVSCLVPAFCEEFLFRGAILTNCLPFGRSNAILISALLFGLMHQNAEQILYAFAAGIFLGIVYERTGSIWVCTFLHLINNFMSTAVTVASNRFGLTLSGVAFVALEGVLYLFGAVCIVILVLRLPPKKPAFQDGLFGISAPATDSYAAIPLAPNRAIRLFLNFPMTCFLSLCVLQILALLGLALLYGLAA